MLSVYDLVDFLACLFGWCNIGWFGCVCCWLVVFVFWWFDGFGVLRFGVWFGFCFWVCMYFG